MGWRPSISSLCGVLPDRVVLTPQLEGVQLGAHEQKPLALVRCPVKCFLALRFHLVLLVRRCSRTSHEARHTSISQKVSTSYLILPNPLTNYLKIDRRC